jgi:hypothetical protein
MGKHERKVSLFALMAISKFFNARFDGRVLAIYKRAAL